MITNGDKWIRIFDIPDTSRHKRGFTIYKVISMLYPESCPDAVTKVTVWKRYNDFRKLHQDLKALHKTLGIKDEFPGLLRGTFFKRFDDETVQQRRQCALHFLEYIGSHFDLFTSKEFVRFFETSHMPANQLHSNINSIRAELNLPEEPEYVSFLSSNSDDERTFSDTDSISTLSSLGASAQITDVLPEHSLQTCTLPKLLVKRLESSSSNSQSSKMSLGSRDSLNITVSSDGPVTFEGQIYPTPPNTPGSSMSDSLAQYIDDAADHIVTAQECEKNKNYEDAFSEYKAGIEILLEHVKGDKNEDRRTTVRYDIQRYLLRAEKIYNMYLSPEIRNFREILNVEKHAPTTEQVVLELYKYKVIKVVGSGMLVLHSDLQQPYFVKVIRKTVNFSTKNMILPENVPFMVKLHSYHNCENALFLILQYCNGVKLWDHIKRTCASLNYELKMNDTFADTHNSDCESDDSYSDLINDYTSSRMKAEQNKLLIDKSLEQIPQTNNPHEDICKKNEDMCDNNTDKKDKFLRKGSDRSLVEELSYVDNCVVVPQSFVVKWAAQLLLALEKLHNLGVICFDLHSDNLLIDEEGDLILTYMCNVNEMHDTFTKRNMFHLAPEIYSFQRITPAVDWWCYGTIMYELLVGMPLKVIHPEGLSTYTSLKIPKYVSAEGRSLLNQLLTCEAQERLGCGINGTEDLKSHPFFNSVSWNSLLLKYKVEAT